MLPKAPSVSSASLTASFTSSPLCWICCTEDCAALRSVLTSRSISSVDCWVRLANARTSSATTAKPRPCSPARAASIAAFKANKLVCSATLWITLKTVPIFWICALRLSILALALLLDVASNSIRCRLMRTTCWPLSTLASAVCAAWAACSALRATSCTVAVIWFIAVATCSVSSFWLLTSAVVCSVTLDNECAELASCSIPACNPLTIWLKLLPICCIACISWPISSRRLISMRPLRSPEAICWATAITARNGATIKRVITHAAIKPTSSARADEPMISNVLCCNCVCMDWSSAAYAWLTRLTTCSARSCNCV